MSVWFERFFDSLYEHILAGQFTSAQNQREAGAIIRLLALRRGKRVLDIPCGMGRLTLPLARRGLRMTGVELMPRYLRRARREAQRAGLDIEWIEQDMRKIACRDAFDAAVTWFGSFGYFSDRQNAAFCRRMWRSLRPGGRFLIEGLNRSWLVRHFHGGVDETVAGVRICHRHCWDERHKRIRDTWVMSRNGVTQRRTISVRVYSGPELRRVLREAGFCNIRLFGNMERQPLSRHTPRLLAVAQRPTETPSKTRKNTR